MQSILFVGMRFFALVLSVLEVQIDGSSDLVISSARLFCVADEV